MKTISTLITLTVVHLIQAQVMHQTVREDQSFDYWFSLDHYQKPLNYAIEIAHAGGNIHHLTGKIPGYNKAGTVTISDTEGSLLFRKELGADLAFEFATEQDDLVIEFTVNGFVTYSKKISAKTLSMLVLKLQPEPSDDIYQVHSIKGLSDIELEAIMQCVHANRNKNLKSCEKKDEYTIRMEI